MNYRQAMEYLESIKGLGIVPGLYNIRELCERLGNPQNQVKFIHVAGTNAKGSVIAFMSEILIQAGYKTGRYVSPSVFSYWEKIQVDHKNITQKAVCEGIDLIKTACDDMTAEGKPHPTVFEVETALAFWYFAKKGCEIAVIETGMGGLQDATNLITTTITSVITPVGMDHMSFLGNTLAEIAAQKAGIIKKGAPVVSGRQEAEVLKVIDKKAKEEECELVIADMSKVSDVRYGISKQSFRYSGLGRIGITMAGCYQIENAVLSLNVIRTLQNLGLKIGGEAIRSGFLQAAWPGRFSVVFRKPLFVMDGAHNEAAAKKLAESIEFYFTNKRIIYIMGVLRDKEYEKVIGLTHAYADQIITVTPPRNPRALSAYELAQAVAKVHPNVTCADSLAEAAEMAGLLAGKEDVVIAFGSLSFLGELWKILQQK